MWSDKSGNIDNRLAKSLVAKGAVLTDCWQQAVVHIVNDVAKPGQRASWSARLGGHLFATPRLGNGPWIQSLLGIVSPVACQLPCLRVGHRLEVPYSGTRQDSHTSAFADHVRVQQAASRTCGTTAAPFGRWLGAVGPLLANMSYFSSHGWSCSYC